jgi:hypothetical protein
LGTAISTSVIKKPPPPVTYGVSEIPGKVNPIVQLFGLLNMFRGLYLLSTSICNFEAAKGELA